MSRKITLIGAGSVVFAKTLIGDILQFPELADSTICLMDIDPDRLKVADIMMKRVAAKLGVAAKVESTMDRREAIRGAKYVICTIQVGGYRPSTIADFEIPKKYGLKQTIADTLGIGGIFRGLRTIPVLLDIAEDIAEVAHPDCLFLNYTNPMAMNCWAVDEAVGIPHVGLCHSVFGTANQLASQVCLPIEDVTYLVAGINHMAFFLNFKYQGQDAYPLLFKALDNPNRANERVRFEMMRRLGYFVTESSEHQSEYVPHFIHFGQEMIDAFDIPVDEYIRRCESIMSTWKKTEAELIGETGEIEVSPQSHEYGSYIIHSRETDTPRTVYGNVPNNGIIDNLEPGCCVEVPCLVDGNGLQPTKIGLLPPQLAAICMTNVNVQRLTVTAALTQKREHIYHAAMMDPHTAATLPLDKIWAMCDELIEQHQKDGFLGAFEPTIPNTGRGFEGVGDQILVTANALGLRLDQAGSDFDLEIALENPTRDAVSVELAVVAGNEAITFDESTVRLEADAGEKAMIALQGKVNSAVEERTPINLKAARPDVLAVGTVLIPRRNLEPGPGGQAEFDLALSGFPCAHGKIRRVAGGVELEMEVKDSNPKVDFENFWKGSCVELFFSSDASPEIRQIFVVPAADDQAGLYASRNQKLETEFEIERTKLDYTFRTVIPHAETGLAEQGPFRFDAIVRVGALGDAHSGGRTSLSGKFNGNANSDFAWLVTA